MITPGCLVRALTSEEQRSANIFQRMVYDAPRGDDGRYPPYGYVIDQGLVLTVADGHISMLSSVPSLSGIFFSPVVYWRCACSKVNDD